MFTRDFNLQEKQHLFFLLLQLYLTFHSYGQYILYPWGYARKDTPDRNDLHSLGLKGAQAAKSINGRRYSVGTAAKMLYPAAGIQFLFQSNGILWILMIRCNDLKDSGDFKSISTM